MAANPYGLKLIGHLSGSPGHARIRKYFHSASDANAIFMGDAVKTDTVNDADSVTGVEAVTPVTESDVIRGVVVGVEPILGVAVGSENLNRMHCPASTAMYILVCDDPWATFLCQSDGTTALANVGENVDLTTATAGSTTTGQSGMAIDEDTHVTTSAQLRILQIVERVGETVASANGNYIVMINKHELKQTSGV